MYSEEMFAFRMLALFAATSAAARIVYYRMLGWNQELQGWPEICAMIGALVLFWIATQKMRRPSEVRGTALLGAVLLLVHELPFVSTMLNGFLRTDRSLLELLAVTPMALCLALAYFALRGMVG
jgi:hypothetical protein